MIAGKGHHSHRRLRQSLTVPNDNHAACSGAVKTVVGLSALGLAFDSEYTSSLDSLTREDGVTESHVDFSHLTQV